MRTRFAGRNTGDERASMDAERLGQQLRGAREAQELTLEQVEQTLRIRARFLAAFESGAYEDLPGAVQARGFLRNYARFLNLDADGVVAQFDAIQRGGRRHVPDLIRRSETSPRPILPGAPLHDQSSAAGANVGRGRRPGILLGSLLGLLVMMILCVGGVQIVERLLNADANREEPDLLSILPTVPTLTASATFVPSPTPAAGQQIPAGATPITDRVVLQIVVTERTYMRVIADGTQIFEGIVRPGTALQYQAQQTLNIQASNGIGLDVVFNNLPLGPLGLRGEAIDTTFTPDLVLTPTPDFAPTATFTPLPPPTALGGADAESESGGPGNTSGKSGQGDGTLPTALPLPGQASDVVGGSPSPAAQPTAALLPSATPAPTLTATATVSPAPTLTPSPTAILPPRQTSTPIPEK